MIGARLADLRDWNNQTQEDLAKALNVATSTIRSWEHEKSSPNHEMLIAICRYYGTSADYLLGLTDIAPSILAAFDIKLPRSVARTPVIRSGRRAGG